MLLYSVVGTVFSYGVHRLVHRLFLIILEKTLILHVWVCLKLLYVSCNFNIQIYNIKFPSLFVCVCNMELEVLHGVCFFHTSR